MELKVENEDLTLIPFYSLPSSYTTFIDTLLYSSDKIFLEEVYDVLFFKKKIKQLVVNFETQKESLIVRGKTSERDIGDGRRRRSKSRNKTVKCYYCKKMGHLRQSGQL